MANANNFYIGANDEHGQFPPTIGKRTPTMPYINQSFYENEFNRPAKYNFLIACLRTGFDVFDIKPQFSDLGITQRVTRTNRQNLTCVVTFAFNASGNGTTFNNVRGHQVFYSRENRFSNASRLLAFDTQQGLDQTIDTPSLGIATLTEIGMLRSVNCPAVLPECGFMTNFDEAKLMIDPDFQKNCGEGVCIGICDNLDVNYTANVSYRQLPTLRRGNRGKGVKFLQCYLNLYGEALSIDGIFGLDTQSAVQRFQQQNNLVTDGIAGQNTWWTLLMQRPLPLLRRGDTGVYVRYLQQKLISKLYLADEADGIFGRLTQQAVKDFQQENNLAADGIVGPLTWPAVSSVGGGRQLPSI